MFIEMKTLCKIINSSNKYQLVEYPIEIEFYLARMKLLTTKVIFENHLNFPYLNLKLSNSSN
jgi:hypothetical protein